jgi:nicotinate (nicotinamide) nucleotide adenylyltransferase
MPQSTPTKIALFGGSFNPLTLMHLEMIHQLAEHFSKIILLPSFSPPHKNQKDLLPFELRLKLCQIALENRPELEQKVEVQNFEELYFEKTQGFSYLLLKQIQNDLFPSNTLHWVMGYDQFEKIHTWHQYQKLCAEFPLVVFSRNGKQGQLGQNLEWDDHFLKPLFLEKGTEGPSASLIRQALLAMRMQNQNSQDLSIEGLDSAVLKAYLQYEHSFPAE